MDLASTAEPRPDAAQAVLDCPAGGACARHAGPGAEGFSHARSLARILARATQPMVGVDFNGRITCANLAFGALAGVDAAALVGRPLAELTPERWLERLSRTLAKVRDTGKSLKFEAELLRADGGVVPIDAAVEPDRGPDGGLVGAYALISDLTERKASEERFRRLYDDAPVGYHEVDTEGRIVSVNRTECEMLGYAREDLVGRPVFDLLTDESRARALVAFPEKVSGRRPLRTIERTLVTRDGREIQVSIEERYRRDGEGKIIGLLSSVQDVTDRKRTEAALQASERRARALFEGIGDAIFVHALDGRILDANPAASRLLGYPREELLSLTTRDIDDPEFAAGYADRLALQMAQGHARFEGRHRTRDGRVIPVEIHTSAIRFDDQRAVLAVITDISDRQALEETRRAFAEAGERNAREIASKNAELTRSEARYRELTEGCLDGVVAADREGLVTLLNPAGGRIFGYDPGEVVGRPIGLLMPALTPRPGRPFGEDVFDREPGVVGRTVELTGRRKSGEEFPLELSLSAAGAGADVQFVGSIRDQTERKRMRAVLAQSERLASIGLLSAGVAHEINNPLAYVANNLAVLERDAGGMVRLIEAYEAARPALAAADPAALRPADEAAEALDWEYVRENLPRMLARTREGVQRVATIVANLRWLARTSPTKMEEVRIPDLLEIALEMVRVRLRRSHIEARVEHGDVPPLVCVPTQISQVLLNLLINACQAVEGSGRTEGGLIRFASEYDGASVVLTVSDNGPGIPPEALPRLFDPFFTTKGVGEGTGLGLSICDGIVGGHGGRIEVESRPGEGATFRVILPVRPA